MIDGLDTLDALERCQVNEKHRPLSELRLKHVTVHANPLAVRAAFSGTCGVRVVLCGYVSTHMPPQDQMIIFPSANGAPDIQG